MQGAQSSTPCPKFVCDPQHYAPVKKKSSNIISRK